MERKEEEISVNNLLALAHVLDDYEEFNKKLKRFVSIKYNRDDIYNLDNVSNGKFSLSLKVKKFYQENKDIIDVINKYSSISNFIFYIYDHNGKYASWCCIESFYKYLMKNKDKINEIISLVEMIQELGFDKIKFNEEADFKNVIYNLELSSINSIFYSIICNTYYLENMELISGYNTDVIMYKTNGSNYCMKLPNRDDSKDWIGKEITVNNLLFDISCLPKSLKKEDTIDKIVALKETKKEEKLSIKDLVDLGVSISDFDKAFIKINATVERLESVKSKDEIIQALLNIKLELEKIKQLNNNEILENKLVTDEQIEFEKKKYLNWREFQYLDLD